MHCVCLKFKGKQKTVKQKYKLFNNVKPTVFVSAHTKFSTKKYSYLVSNIVNKVSGSERKFAVHNWILTIY